MRKTLIALILTITVVLAGTPVAGAADTAPPPQCLYDTLPFPQPPAYPCTPPPGDENCAPYIDRFGMTLEATKRHVVMALQLATGQADALRADVSALERINRRLERKAHRKARTIRHLRAEIRRLRATQG
jgi:hypothetical protein